MTEGIGHAFLEETKYSKLEPSNQQRGTPQPPLHAVLREGRRVALPGPPFEGLGHKALHGVIETRRSLRTYAQTALTLQEFAFLLWATQGIHHATEKHTLRSAPSAGARHAFETVVLAHRVDGLEPGFYQYDAVTHGVIPWDMPADGADRLVSACLDQAMLGTSAAVFIWIADWPRMAWRYGERGMRYLLLDAGHVCQNLYLAAESVHAGACAIGAFDDDAVNGLLGLDGDERFALYLACVGKRDGSGSA